MAKTPRFRAKRHPKRPVQKVKTVPSPPSSNLDVKIQLVEQEIKFAKALAGHEPRIQAKVLKNLKKWLTLRSQSSFPFNNQDFLRLWKALFYAMWMSDKPLVQEQLAEDIGALLHCFPTPQVSMQFYSVFLQTMNREWYGIDQWRIDKFMMLIRRVTRQCLVVLRDNNWRLDLIKQFRKSFKSHIFGEMRISVGLSMHFLDLYLEEVAKVSGGSIKRATVTSLIRPFVTILARINDTRITVAVVKNIFHNLLYQSDLGRQYREKFEVWKSFGFPTASIDDLEMVEEANDAESEESNDEANEEEAPSEKTALDPRAGRVNVVLPEMKFNPRAILKVLEKALYDPETKSKPRKRLKSVISQYEKFAEGVFPLGIQRMPVLRDEAGKLPTIEEKVVELEEFEKSLTSSTKLLKSLTKSERKRFMRSGKKIEEFVQELNKTKAKVNGVAAEVTNGLNGRASEVKKAPPKKRKVPMFKEEPLDPWTEPLEEGEQEYFVPSMKKRLEKANRKSDEEKTVINPFAVKAKKLKVAPESSSVKKKVRIALEKNTFQDTHQYLKQVRSSPQIPYDSSRKPAKSLLKPNLIPGPLNPFYMKKMKAKKLNFTS
ncbi:ribosomal RNA processing protein 1 homolog [Phlebotomus argentipes]|uniref:ribosomal RNA processing protein 1 homolog n=1 Tax=Phlebotomus argentipes TaxID=94469 RepID=UPI0028937F36|nr:ribosomal RNA processing protein 1 homolog [Phlebotomus argentipes]